MKRFSLILAGLVSFALAACGQSSSDDAAAMATSSGRPFIVVSQMTVLKKTTEDSSTLQMGSEKCNIPAGTKLELSETPQIQSNHYLVNTAELLPNCGFSKGYVFSGHVSQSSLGSSFSAGANVKAFLDVIGYAEGTGDSYDIMFTHARFYGFADHPRQIRCSYGLCSDAAGRYQFLSTTWDNLAGRLGLGSFSPENQDRAAVQLLKDKGVYNTIVNIAGYGDFERAAYGVSTTWASFPGSPYGQPTHSTSQLYEVFQRSVSRY